MSLATVGSMDGERREPGTHGGLGDQSVGDMPVFVALDSGRTVDAAGSTIPTVVIDAGDVPAVADLARVHAIEGVGDIRTTAVRTEDVLVLGIGMTTPVNAAFAVAFDLSRHRAVLDDAARFGTLVIAHTDPECAETDHPCWLAVDLDGDALSRCLGAR